jgi:hypothetical protein
VIFCKLKHSYYYVCSVLCILSHCSVYCLFVNVYWTTATGISGHFSTTQAEVFPCFFLSCEANARLELAKTGHGLHFPFFSFYCYVCSVLCVLCTAFSFCVCVCVFVNVYCNTATGCQPDCNNNNNNNNNICRYIHIFTQGVIQKIIFCVYAPCYITFSTSISLGFSTPGI